MLFLGGGVGSRPEELHNPQKPVSEVRVCLTWWQVCGAGDRVERSTFGRRFVGLDTPVSTGMNVHVGEDLIHTGRPDKAHPTSRY